MPPKRRPVTRTLWDIHPGEILTTEDTARVLKVSQRTVQRLVEAHTLKAFQVGHQCRILGRDLYIFCGYATALPQLPTHGRPIDPTDPTHD